MLRIYDTLQRKKVEFKPMAPPRVGMYVCGITTYDDCHIGHARSQISFDVVARWLRASGYQLTYVRNVTDIDDKIIARGNERGEDPLALSRRFTERMREDFAAVGIQPPDHEPLATETIPEMVAMIEQMVEAGKAYAVDGDVYFAVETFPPYGRLSGQSLDDLRAGARVESDERKRSPLDFALWKAAKPGEPAWDTPWGKGRPGWHIECSAMSKKLLGDTFDIHGGGKDLVFPHHENEIAQSQSCTGEHSFARLWMHNGFLNFSGEKMSKSLGNVFGIRTICERHEGEALRWFMLSGHYRSPLSFEVERGEDDQPRFTSLEDAERKVDYVYNTRKRVADGGGAGAPEPGALVPEIEGFRAAFSDAMDDDFNTALALAHLEGACAAANRLLDTPGGVAKDVRRRSLRRATADLAWACGVLGVGGEEPGPWLTRRRDRLAARRGIDGADVERQIGERTAARKAKDFARADAIRGELAARGVELMDGPDGTSWRVVG